MDAAQRRIDMLIREIERLDGELRVVVRSSDRERIEAERFRIRRQRHSYLMALEVARTHAGPEGGPAQG